MNKRQAGFSLIELMVVILIFAIISAAILRLLDVAQLRYRSEQQLLDSFKSSRDAVDLMVRDIRNAGYPPPFTYAGNLNYPPTGPTPVLTPAPVPWTDPAAAGQTLQNRFSAGIVGFNAGLVRDMTCTVNGGANPCRIPNPWDIVLELDLDPENNLPGQPPSIELVRYNLCWADPNGPCVPVTGNAPPPNAPPWLVRSISTKNMVANPTGALTGIVPPLTSSVPLVEVIIQNPAEAPNALLPDNSVNTPLFQYVCAGGAAFCTVEQIDSVIVTIRTRGRERDVQTRRFRAATIQGMARRLNPSR
ncbi:MAG TPA: type II secretion system protein [Candidatus Xenobia bacterium]|nr:type II secretion system protein [Candidatus Xenobia bacterium]